VKSLAITLGLSVLQPVKARDPAFLNELVAFEPELIIVAAYGQILPKSILELPEFGCLNVHASLLPQYRGAAPVQWAILNDESKTGVTIMKMDEGLDTGGIVATESTVIATEDDAQSLHDRLARIGADLLRRTIPDYVAGQLAPQPQPSEGASYARKIVKEDGRLDWTLPSRTLWNRIRAFTLWPGACTSLRIGSGPALLKIWSAAVAEDVTGQPGRVVHASGGSLIIGTGDGALRILSLQLEGGKRLDVDRFLAGHRLKAGDQLG
jgi:methionyl-tRNA formyltransferase